MSSPSSSVSRLSCIIRGTRTPFFLLPSMSTRAFACLITRCVAFCFLTVPSFASWFALKRALARFSASCTAGATTVLAIWPWVGPPSRYRSTWSPNAATASLTVWALSSPDRFALEAATGPVTRRIRKDSAEFGTRIACVACPSDSWRIVFNRQSCSATAIGENAPGRKAAARRFNGAGRYRPKSSTLSASAMITCNALYLGRRLSS